MKVYTSENVRNVALLGHSGSGKSSMAEALLFLNKKIDRLGTTQDGNLTADYDPEEAARSISINTSLIPIETKQTKINLLDCPGARDFLGEAKAGVHAADGCLIFVDGHSGIQVGTELAIEYAEEAALPVAFCINKLDQENVNYAALIDELTETFGKKAVALTIPIGEADGLKGYVDVSRMKAVTYDGNEPATGDIPADMQQAAEAARETLVEAAAEGDEALMEKYFEEGELSDEEVGQGLKKAFREGSFMPVFCTAATRCIGAGALLHFFEEVFPTPLEMPGLKKEDGEFQPIDASAPLSAFVFKTVADDFAGRLTFFKVVTGSFTSSAAIHNLREGKAEKVSHVLTICGKKQDEVEAIHAGDIGVVAKLTATGTGDTLGDPKCELRYAHTVLPQLPAVIAIKARSAQDEDKIGIGLHALMEQDPTLKLTRDPETKQTLLAGMGDQHLDVAVSRLKAKSKVEVDIIPAKIRYRETIRKKAEGVYRHKKQSGGRGQFAEVAIRLEPLTNGENYEFKWSVFGGAIPTNFQSAVDKGAQQALENGILAGYHCVGILVDCFDGKHHPVDSSDMAFQIAASQAFKQIAAKADPIILEPVSLVTTTVPEANMGDVMGDISQRRGKIQGSENIGKKVVVKAHVPDAELANYSQNLTSMTGGHGIFEREFSHYDPVPGDVQAKIIAEAQKEAEEEA